MARQPTTTDVVVQGGGMVGLAAATALAGRGLAVTVLDHQPPSTWQGGAYRLQVTSLNRASEASLDALGAWSRLPQWRATPVRRIEATDRHDGPLVAFDVAEMGESHLAHIVENEMLVAGLAEAAERAGVRWRRPATVADWSDNGDALDLLLDDRTRLGARLLVGADGAGSPVRALTGITTETGDYGQAGVVTVVQGRRPHGGIARQRFLPGGPLAFLPLGEDQAAIVWSRPEAEAERLLGLETADFRNELAAAAGDWLGGVEAVGERARFPLRWLRARNYVCQRVALVGDAAHVIHPLAGQGANLGIADAAELARAVGDAVDRGRDPGDWLALRRYERGRREANETMQWLMNAFHWGFDGDAPALRGIRRAAFGITGRATPLRRAFMAHAMGWR
jgi:2-octaprenylphenol hydroxylase